MSNKLQIVAFLAMTSLVGCRSHEKQYSNPNDRVDVRFPGGRVRVGENGGVNVKAPLTNVQTSQYRQTAPKNSTQYDPPAWGEGSSRTDSTGAEGGVRRASIWSPAENGGGASSDRDVIQLPAPPRMNVNE